MSRTDDHGRGPGPLRQLRPIYISPGALERVASRLGLRDSVAGPSRLQNAVAANCPGCGALALARHTDWLLRCFDCGAVVSLRASALVGAFRAMARRAEQRPSEASRVDDLNVEAATVTDGCCS